MVETEGAGQVIEGTAIDAADNEGRGGLVLAVDLSDPIIMGSIIPPLNGNLWGNTPSTVHFEGFDAVSGIATVTGDVRVEEEGIHEVTGTAVDLAGRSASTTVEIRLDFTPVSFRDLQPSEGEILRDPWPVLSGSFSDNLSGPALESLVVRLDGQDVTQGAEVSETGFSAVPTADLADGVHTLMVSMADNAGNMSAAATTFMTDV
ncbi:MAG: hypothetical protein HYU36_01290, partial [Planctomycetes bacterium]|nr:hypothetical protein [Planctomycetota bacterium]